MLIKTYHDKTKFDDWNIMESFIELDDFLFISDIRQDYYHIDNDPNHQ